MSTPANAVAVATVLAEIDADPGTIANRSQQDSFFKRLTSRYKFRYYSSTYGHTCHDEKSLRSVLVAIMRHHGKDGEDIRPGKTAVDELFERGSEMLQDNYVKAVKEAAKHVELEEDSDSEDSEESSEVDQELIDFVEAQTDSDDEYMPTMGRRTRSAKQNRHRPSPIANSKSKETYIDTWISDCSIGYTEAQSPPVGNAFSSISVTSSDLSSSIAVLRSLKRKASALTSSTLSDTSDSVSNNRHSSATSRSKAVGSQPRTSHRSFAVPRTKSLNRQLLQTPDVSASPIVQDPMLSVKLLAVAAIAALL